MDRKQITPGLSMTLLCSNAGRFFLVFIMVIFSTRVMSQNIITKSPTDESRCAGFPIYFSVEPNNAPDYQWQVDKNDNAGFTDIAGAKGYSYGDINTRAQMTMNGYRYRVIVKNAAGESQTSTAAKLTVNATPSITVIPTSTTVCEHATATFSVSATGSGALTYKWAQKPPSGSYTFLTNTDSPTLRLSDVLSVMDGYQYWVEVYNKDSEGNCLATTKSDNTAKQAFLRVTPAPLLTITNPAPACGSTTSTVDLTLPAVTAGSTSSLAFSYFTDMAATAVLNQPNAVTRGGTYYIRGTKDGCNTELKPVLVTINVAPAVTAAPQEQEVVCSGGDTGIILTDPNNAGNTTLFKWTVSTNANITGASSQTSPVAGLIIQNLTNASSTTQTITYTITPVASPCPDGTPVGVNVQVVPTDPAAPAPNLTLNPSAVSVCSGVSLSAAISPPGTYYKWTFLPFNNNVTGGRSQGAISPGPLTDILTSAASTNQVATYLVSAYGNNCAGRRTRLDVTVKPQPAVKATPAQVSICSGGSTDVVLEDTSGMQGTRYTWTASTISTALGDIQSQNRTTAGDSPMTVKLTSNSSTTTERATYTVTPAATNGCSGTPLQVPVSVSPPPVGITEQPASKTLCVGDKLELTVKAGTSAVTYQWKKDGSAITGATNASYAIEALAAADAGKYRAEVTASGCTSPSTEAEVIVQEGASFFGTATATASSHAIAYTGSVDFEYTGPEAVLEWKFGDQTGSPMAKVRHYYYKSNTFLPELTARRNLSCSKSFTVGEIRVEGPDVEIVTANETRGGLTFFPNPVRDRLHLKSEDTLQSVTLFDAMGKAVTTFVLEGKEDVVEVETLPPGLYVIRVKTQKESVNFKLMKQ